MIGSCIFCYLFHILDFFPWYDTILLEETSWDNKVENRAKSVVNHLPGSTLS